MLKVVSEKARQAGVAIDRLQATVGSARRWNISGAMVVRTVASLWILGRGAENVNSAPLRPFSARIKPGTMRALNGISTNRCRSAARARKDGSLHVPVALALEFAVGQQPKT